MFSYFGLQQNTTIICPNLEHIKMRGLILFCTLNVVDFLPSFLKFGAYTKSRIEKGAIGRIFFLHLCAWFIFSLYI